MARVVWKYEWPHNDFAPNERATFEMWHNAKIRHVATQDGKICLWAVTEDNQPKELRTFVLVGTGWASPEIEGAAYVGTAHAHDGRLVWHIFEIIDDGSGLLPIYRPRDAEGR